MGIRLIIFIIACSIFSFIFYLSSYQAEFDPKSPLTSNTIDTTKKNYDENQAALAQKLAEAENPSLEKKVEQPEEVVIDMKNPAIKNGFDVFHEKGSCIQCHGDMGQGNKDVEAPLLAGQYDWYVYNQLVAFKTGKRNNPAMTPFLESLTDEDFKNVASYISLLRIKPEAAPATDAESTKNAEPKK